MHMLEDTMLLMARERMEDALRHAEQRRALRAAHPPRRPLRVCLGTALVRVGHRIMGHPYSPNGECGMRIAE